MWANLVPLTQAEMEGVEPTARETGRSKPLMQLKKQHPVAGARCGR